MGSRVAVTVRPREEYSSLWPSVGRVAREQGHVQGFHGGNELREDVGMSLALSSVLLV